MINEFSNGRCEGSRCIHYIMLCRAKHGKFIVCSTCNVLSDACEDGIIDKLIDNNDLYPCEKYCDKNFDMDN